MKKCKHCGKPIMGIFHTCQETGVTYDSSLFDTIVAIEVAEDLIGSNDDFGVNDSDTQSDFGDSSNSDLSGGGGDFGGAGAGGDW